MCVLFQCTLNDKCMSFRTRDHRLLDDDILTIKF